MQDLKIDNDFLNSLADKIEDLHKDINDFIIKLRDEDEDVFSRYMAFVHLRAYYYMAIFNMKNIKNAVVSGFDIQLPIFQTKNAKKGGWDKPITDNNPFFDSEKESNNDDMDENIKELIKMLIKKSINKDE